MADDTKLIATDMLSKNLHDSEADLQMPSFATPNDYPTASSIIRSAVDKESMIYLLITNLKEPLGHEKIREMTDTCTVQQILYAINADDSVDYVQKVSRIGHYSPAGEPRQVVVGFTSEAAPKSVLSKAERLAKFPEWKDVSLHPYHVNALQTFPFWKDLVPYSIIPHNDAKNVQDDFKSCAITKIEHDNELQNIYGANSTSDKSLVCSSTIKSCLSNDEINCFTKSLLTVFENRHGSTVFPVYASESEIVTESGDEPKIIIIPIRKADNSCSLAVFNKNHAINVDSMTEKISDEFEHVTQIMEKRMQTHDKDFKYTQGNLDKELLNSQNNAIYSAAHICRIIEQIFLTGEIHILSPFDIAEESKRINKIINTWHSNSKESFLWPKTIQETVAEARKFLFMDFETCGVPTLYISAQQLDKYFAALVSYGYHYHQVAVMSVHYSINHENIPDISTMIEPKNSMPKKLLVPIGYQQHVTLAVFDFEKGKENYIYFDSEKSPPPPIFHNIKEAVQNHFGIKQMSGTWLTNINEQHDDYNCGIFVSRTAELFMFENHYYRLSPFNIQIERLRISSILRLVNDPKWNNSLWLRSFYRHDYEDDSYMEYGQYGKVDQEIQTSDAEKVDQQIQTTDAEKVDQQIQTDAQNDSVDSIKMVKEMVQDTTVTIEHALRGSGVKSPDIQVQMAKKAEEIQKNVEKYKQTIKLIQKCQQQLKGHFTTPAVVFPPESATCYKIYIESGENVLSEIKNEIAKLALPESSSEPTPPEKEVTDESEKTD